MTERYNGATRLRRLHGMRGYGVYCRVVELCLSAPGKKLRYDLDDLVFDIREDKDFIKEIVEGFGLFIIDGDYIEDIYSRSPEAIEKERQAQIRANRSAGAKKAAATRRAKKEAALVQENAPGAPTPAPEPVVVIDTPEPPDVDARAPISIRFDKIKSIWNTVFKGSRRMVTTDIPDAITWHYFQESAKFFTDRDYEEAFEQAKQEDFAWQFRDALKTSNLQRLLTASEKRALAERNDDEELDEATKEMIEYGERMGWNWDKTRR